MTTEVLDILIYLFESSVEDEYAIIPDQDRIRQRLEQEGFHQNKVTKAFAWLNDLASLKENYPDIEAVNSKGFRVFNTQELGKIDQYARALLVNLVDLDIITPVQRELVIDKALELDIHHLDTEQIKWVILMVLFNSPESENAHSWVQDILYSQQLVAH